MKVQFRAGFMLAALLSSPAVFAAEDKTARVNDFCTLEWKITDFAASTEGDIRAYTHAQVAAFKAKGHAFSDLGIDETDFIAQSPGIASTFRARQKSSPHAWDKYARESFHEVMMQACIKKFSAVLP